MDKEFDGSKLYLAMKQYIELNSGKKNSLKIGEKNRLTDKEIQVYINSNKIKRYTDLSDRIKKLNQERLKNLNK